MDYCKMDDAALRELRNQLIEKAKEMTQVGQFDEVAKAVDVVGKIDGLASPEPVNQTEKPEPEVIEEPEAVAPPAVKFGDAAKKLKVSTKTLHRWRRDNRISGCEQTGTNIWQMPVSEFERLKKMKDIENGVNSETTKPP